ncbi:SSU rRNA (adenine(1518)-N(6)/adenine(1519)-N(6))-dimethyltransferase [hydrothermal vent metagenome]|uniref:SSU rRNA (Adenine(1518)-N(6)/adenine(1519)-N(6))-dimethyltransferase n=1 Tax=hydrothermal vent metagenome TaxID=652676 RepID=A0A3B0YAS3_9ZZZZ
MHRARKRFGQNFLHDSGVIQRIVQAVSPQAGQRIVEIGPGQGAITLPLLKVCGKLEVVELDRDLIQPLADKAAGHGELVIYQHDVLKFDFAALAGKDHLRVVGNLPYNISTPLMFHLLSQSAVIQDMHFMLQKEVVDRMSATPGNSDYGRLSVMIQYHCKVDPLFRVKSGAFTPAPKVESAIVRLTPWQQPPAQLDSLADLSILVREAFSQRRKTLRNTLKKLLSAERIEAAGADPRARPETIALEQYIALSNQLTQVQKT